MSPPPPAKHRHSFQYGCHIHTEKHIQHTFTQHLDLEKKKKKSNVPKGLLVWLSKPGVSPLPQRAATILFSSACLVLYINRITWYHTLVAGFLFSKISVWDSPVLLCALVDHWSSARGDLTPPGNSGHHLGTFWVVPLVGPSWGCGSTCSDAQDSPS